MYYFSHLLSKKEEELICWSDSQDVRLWVLIRVDHIFCTLQQVCRCQGYESYYWQRVLVGWYIPNSGLRLQPATKVDHNASVVHVLMWCMHQFVCPVHYAALSVELFPHGMAGVYQITCLAQTKLLYLLLLDELCIPCPCYEEVLFQYVKCLISRTRWLRAAWLFCTVEEGSACKLSWWPPLSL